MKRSLILKTSLLTTTYVASLLCILSAFIWTSFTLSGATEKELLGLDPLNLGDILIYLLKFHLPSLSIQFLIGIAILAFSICLHLYFWKQYRVSRVAK